MFMSFSPSSYSQQIACKLIDKVSALQCIPAVSECDQVPDCQNFNDEDFCGHHISEIHSGSWRQINHKPAQLPWLTTYEEDAVFPVRSHLVTLIACIAVTPKTVWYMVVEPRPLINTPCFKVNI